MSHAKEIRRNIIIEANRTKCPHVGCCLSCVDILSTLYFDHMKLDPWESRDIFILSKGHAALALYSTLCVRGLLKRSTLAKYYTDGGLLPGHLDRFSHKGVEVSAGSLGHGFNVGLGMAHGFKLDGSNRKVYVVVGDGECQEGSIWEGAMFAHNLKLDNFTVIIDANNLQGYARPSEICRSEPMLSKWSAFGWEAFTINGHDHDEIKSALELKTIDRPKALIARTVKGKGVSFMEDEMKWHYYIVTDEHKDLALKELA